MTRKSSVTVGKFCNFACGHVTLIRYSRVGRILGCLVWDRPPDTICDLFLDPISPIGIFPTPVPLVLNSEIYRKKPEIDPLPLYCSWFWDPSPSSMAWNFTPPPMISKATSWPAMRGDLANIYLYRMPGQYTRHNPPPPVCWVAYHHAHAGESNSVEFHEIYRTDHN